MRKILHQCCSMSGKTMQSSAAWSLRRRLQASSVFPERQPTAVQGLEIHYAFGRSCAFHSFQPRLQAQSHSRFQVRDWNVHRTFSTRKPFSRSVRFSVFNFRWRETRSSNSLSSSMQRLGAVVVGPALHGLDCGLDRVVFSHHHDYRVGLAFADLMQRLPSSRLAVSGRAAQHQYSVCRANGFGKAPNECGNGIERPIPSRIGKSAPTSFPVVPALHFGKFRRTRANWLGQRSYNAVTQEHGHGGKSAAFVSRIHAR